MRLPPLRIVFLPILSPSLVWGRLSSGLDTEALGMEEEKGRMWRREAKRWGQQRLSLVARTSPSVACLCFQSESVMEWLCREGPKRTSPYPGQADKEVVLLRSQQHRDWHCQALTVALTQVTSLR